MNSINHMRMQLFVIFLKKTLKTKNSKDKKVRNHCHYIEDYRGAAQSICNFKSILPKEISIVFHN